MHKRLQHNRTKVKNLVFMAVFTALAFAVTLVIRFPVPPFLTLDLKDAVIAIGAMACGPASAILMTAAVALLEFISVGDTGVYGLLMDIISSVGFAFTAALIYKYKKTFLGAIVSLTAAVFTATILMLAANLLITPHYTGMTASGVKEMIPALLLPFNLLKAVLNAGLVALLYKPLTGALSRVIGGTKRNTAERLSARTFIMTGCALAVILAALLILYFGMDARVEFGL